MEERTGCFALLNSYFYVRLPVCVCVMGLLRVSMDLNIAFSGHTYLLLVLILNYLQSYIIF